MLGYKFKHFPHLPKVKKQTASGSVSLIDWFCSTGKYLQQNKLVKLA